MPTTYATVEEYRLDTGDHGRSCFSRTYAAVRKVEGASANLGKEKTNRRPAGVSAFAGHRRSA